MAATLQYLRYTLPKACIGSERSVLAARFGPEESEKKAYIQAGLHADEPPGYLVATRLIELLMQADAVGDIRQQIVIVPAANPIGLGQWGTDTIQGRFDNSDNINFNRRYDDLEAEVASGIKGQLTSDSKKNIRLIRECTAKVLRARNNVTEAEFLKNLLLTLSHDADIVLDLHCDFQAVVHIYMGEPGWSTGKDLSAQMGAYATLLAQDSGDTPFDEANSKLWWRLAKRFSGYPIPPACFAATIELRGVLDTEAWQTELDAQNLLAFLTRRGYVSGEAPVLPDLLGHATPLEGVDYVCAPAAGILTFLKKPGDKVYEGEGIAEVTDPHGLIESDGKVGRGRYVIRSRTSGVLFARSVDRFARPGKVVAKIAGDTPLMEKGSYLLTF